MEIEKDFKDLAKKMETIVKKTVDKREEYENVVRTLCEKRMKEILKTFTPWVEAYKKLNKELQDRHIDGFNDIKIGYKIKTDENENNKEEIDYFSVNINPEKDNFTIVAYYSTFKEAPVFYSERTVTVRNIDSFCIDNDFLKHKIDWLEKLVIKSRTFRNWNQEDFTNNINKIAKKEAKRIINIYSAKKEYMEYILSTFNIVNFFK